MSSGSDGVVVGIDLGTTNSCVAVSADVQIPGVAEKIAAGRLRPVSGALVITDKYRSPITPSAVWIDRDGTPVVGARAKHKARQSGEPAPALFFKRDMSGSERLTAGHARITPQEASAHVLRHLRDLAESVLEVPVTRAIVTVPAFFEVGAKNATTQAGADAGLDVVDTLIEPVAAALAYLAGRTDDRAEEGTFLVYDLGGGTFDASVVAWDSESGFEHLSFDGDRFLGGYDFDQAIVGLLADKTPAYNLKIDSSVPEHRTLLNALLAEAEAVKIELSRSPTAELVKQNLLDCDGEPMILSEPFDRLEFEELVGGRVAETVDRCAAALRKAADKRPDVSAGSLDGIVLVGGSSRIPLVTQQLEDRLAVRPVLVDPDLCVAAGAALQTAFTERPSTYLRIGAPIVLDGRGEINGQVLAGPGLDDPARAVVVLRTDDGEHTVRVRPDAGGGFRFADIPLGDTSFDDADTGVTVAVEVAGRELDSRSETLRRGPDRPHASAVLANSIAVVLRSGRRVVADEGDTVPRHVEIGLRTVNQGVTLPVPVYEGMVPIGEVVISDLPADLPVGTPVSLSVTVGADWTIEVHARVPSVNREGRAVLRLRSFESDSWVTLQARLETVRAQWSEKRNLIDPDTRIEHGPQIEELASEVDELLDRKYDAAKATYRVTVLETMVDNVPLRRGAHLSPPRDHFEDLLRDLDQLCTQLAGVDARRADEFRAELPALRANGDAAYRAESQVDWRKAVDEVGARIAAIENLLRPPSSSGGSGEASAATVRAYVLQEIAQGRDALRERLAGLRPLVVAQAAEELAERLAIAGEAADSAVRAIDADGPDARRRLWRVLHDQVDPWRSQISGFPPTVVVEEDR
jgi:actin-like ATPase involved in cell morphogenesis/predicted RecB family endonuclease